MWILDEILRTIAHWKVKYIVMKEQEYLKQTTIGYRTDDE